MRPDCLDRRIYRETFRAYLLAHAPRSGHGLRTIDADLILAARAAADVAEAILRSSARWMPSGAPTEFAAEHHRLW